MSNNCVTKLGTIPDGGQAVAMQRCACSPTLSLFSTDTRQYLNTYQTFNEALKSLRELQKLWFILTKLDFGSISATQTYYQLHFAAQHGRAGSSFPTSRIHEELTTPLQNCIQIILNIRGKLGKRLLDVCRR